MAYVAAQPPDRMVLAREIADKTNVPIPYLSRILRDAVRHGLLVSTRGIGGGFRMARPPDRIKLFEVLGPYEDIAQPAKCPFGQARCNDDNPCGIHEFWKPIASAFRTMLNDTTLADVMQRPGERLASRRVTRR